MAGESAGGGQGLAQDNPGDPEQDQQCHQGYAGAWRAGQITLWCT